MECSTQPSHSDLLLEHFSDTLPLVSLFNMDFPSMIRLNNIIAVAGSVVYDNCRVYGECLRCWTRSLTTLAGRNDVPLDRLRSRYTSTARRSLTEATESAGRRSNQHCESPRPRPPLVYLAPRTTPWKRNQCHSLSDNTKHQSLSLKWDSIKKCYLFVPNKHNSS